MLDEVGVICLTLVSSTQGNRPKISEKAYEILSVIKQVLGAELVLPKFVMAMDADRSTEFQYILESLYFLHSLVDESDSLEEEIQFTAIVQTIARHLEVFMKSSKK